MYPMQIDENVAETLLMEAVEVTSRRKFEGDIQTTRKALQQGQCDICRMVSDVLVTQIGDYLCGLDKTVKAIYKYEPEHVNISRLHSSTIHTTTKSGINLVVRVERKSAALLTLVAMLESAISETRRRLGCVNSTQECFILDIQLVDERDIIENRGLGLMVNSMYVRSIPVWQRLLPDRPAEQGGALKPFNETNGIMLLYDTELIPESALFEQAFQISNMAQSDRKYYEHHLSELKVALIRRLISDQLAYINIAKRWFTIEDLWEIFQHRIGYGKIGGKAAGMMLAARILAGSNDEKLKAAIHVPDAYFLGADTSYIFMAMNGLIHWNDEKYKSVDQIYDDYPKIRAEFQEGEFPPEINAALENLLGRLGNRPLIVRSSSQLEDNFGTSFAGKYESYFCPNQADLYTNLDALKRSIALIYASTLKPEALLYRKNKGFQDYDERMAILIQEVQGERFGRYFLPYGAGVAFSRNLYRWAPQIKREEGFARLVWGLGTRAVQRVGDDFPRMVALSHPTLQPDDSTEAIRTYSQQYVDVLDLEANEMKTLPIHQVLTPGYPGLRHLVQKEEEGYFSVVRSRVMASSIPQLAITYSELLRRTDFAATMAGLLKLLEDNYQIAVDIEFTISLQENPSGDPEVRVTLLQCRPQSYMGAGITVQFPENLPPEDTLFTTKFMVPHGYIKNIKYILYIPADHYYCLHTARDRQLLSRTISKLNLALADKSFICVGPGRWGTTNHDLGVYVAYADINNAAALVELSGSGIGIPPEPSLGTHFFQDLMEANIYPLAINLDEPGVIFNNEIFEKAPNSVTHFVEVEAPFKECIRLISIEQVRSGHHIEIIMDDEVGRALAFLAPDAGMRNSL